MPCCCMQGRKEGTVASNTGGCLGCRASRAAGRAAGREDRRTWLPSYRSGSGRRAQVSRLRVGPAGLQGAGQEWQEGRSMRVAGWLGRRRLAVRGVLWGPEMLIFASCPAQQHPPKQVQVIVKAAGLQTVQGPLSGRRC